MPTYEYACGKCAHEWEFEQSIKEEPIKVCPKCHGQTARRQISRGTGFILKGSGWYSDLYSSSKPAAKSDKSDDKSKSDTKSSDDKASSSDSSTSSSKPKGDPAPAAA